MVSKRAEVMLKLQQNGVFPDKLIQKKDGSFEYRRNYFYRVQGGGSVENNIAAIKRVFPEARVVDQGDMFNRWPKDSYFMVRFKLP